MAGSKRRIRTQQRLARMLEQAQRIGARQTGHPEAPAGAQKPAGPPSKGAPAQKAPPARAPPGKAPPGKSPPAKSPPSKGAPQPRPMPAAGGPPAKAPPVKAPPGKSPPAAAQGASPATASQPQQEPVFPTDPEFLDGDTEEMHAVLDTDTQDRIASIEERLKGLQNMQDLSELLSVKYNPFLDLEEDQPFEERLGPRDVLAGELGLREKRNGSRPRPGRSQPEEPRAPPAPVVPEPAPAPPLASPQEPISHPDPIAPAPPAPKVAPSGTNGAVPPTESSPGPAITGFRTADMADMHYDERTTPPPSEDAFGRTMFRSPRTHSGGGGAREAFLAMHWFTYLSEGTDPAIIFQYLDYYHFVGWLDDESHSWLCRLAQGVAKRKKDATWNDFGMDLKRLSANHLRNLRFLDKLLGTTLQHGEADYLRQTVDMLLED